MNKLCCLLSPEFICEICNVTYCEECVRLKHLAVGPSSYFWKHEDYCKGAICLSDNGGGRAPLHFAK